MSPPRIGPRGTVILAGPEVEYRVGSLETTGHRAVVHLETVDGRDWSADRPPRPDPQASTYVLRRRDEAARRAFVEEGCLPESLAAARVAVEHVEHHGQPLRFAGSSYPRDTVEHRFRCSDRTCPFVLRWSVTT